MGSTDYLATVSPTACSSFQAGTTILARSAGGFALDTGQE